MSFAQDHSAWQQRISKEVGRRSWFNNKINLEPSLFDYTGMSMDKLAHIQGGNVTSMSPYIRLNQEALDIK